MRRRRSRLAVDSMHLVDFPGAMDVEDESFDWDGWSARERLNYIRGGGRGLVCRDKDQVVAALWYGPGTRKGWVEVASLCVLPEYRRMGLGRKLMKKLIEEWYWEPSCPGIVLQVREDNASAIALYQNLGFQTTKTMRDYYDDGDNALEMRLQLRCKNERRRNPEGNH